MDYVSIKTIHVACAFLTVGLFALRGVLQTGDVRWRRVKFLRVAPHLIDTVLLTAGITLAWMLALNPLTQTWLAAKILGLLVYIALGRQALKQGTYQARALVAALTVVMYIVAVAFTKSPTLGLL